MLPYWLSLASLISVASAGYISAPLRVSRAFNRFAKREEFTALVENNVFYYTVDIGIGTPPQNITAVLDTGSADLWVMKSSNPYCSSANQTCDGKVFTPEKSSSYKATNETFEIRYGDYSYAEGNWAKDSIDISGISLTDVPFSIAEKSNSTQIVMGIGLPALESTVTGVSSAGEANGSYNNIPQLLKSQGYIDAIVYSLWLNDIDADDGSILFGAVDSSKYQGELNILPMINLSKHLKNPYSFHIMINGLSVQSSGGEKEKLAELAYPALLDSGTSFSYLPMELVGALASSIDYTYNGEFHYFVGSCDIPSDKTVYFNFSGVDIPVPFSSLIMPYSTKHPGLCALVVLPSHSEYSTILGDVFLRNVYVAFDLENYEIGIAPANRNVTETSISVVKNRLDGIRAPLYSDVTPQQNITIMGSEFSGGEKYARETENAAALGSVSRFLLYTLFFVLI